MKKVYLSIIILMLGITLIGCNSDSQNSLKDYNDNDVAAIVKDKEITIGELRFLYSDDKVLDNIKGTVKAELVAQEAQKMNLDISDELNDIDTTLPSKEVDNPSAKSTRDFAESQAQKLDMKPEKYYKEYKEVTTKQTAYMNAYTQKKLGEPKNDDEEATKKYNKKANQLLNNLLKENDDDIEILING